MKKFITLIYLLTTPLLSQDILPLRERASLIDQIQKERIEKLLPKLMEEQDIDVWVMITREYNEDPIVKTLLPPTWLNARRRTILVFSKTKNGIDPVAISRYNFGKNIRSIWNKEQQPDQWKALSDYIVNQNPQKIGVNMSEYYGIIDGLAKTDYDGLIQALPSKYQKRIVSAETLGVRWIETRTSLEIKLYNQLVEITHKIINEAFFGFIKLIVMVGAMTIFLESKYVNNIINHFRTLWSKTNMHWEWPEDIFVFLSMIFLKSLMSPSQSDAFNSVSSKTPLVSL